jgi:hypothetical protein
MSKRQGVEWFIATLRAAHLLTGCLVAHPSKTTPVILPLRFAHPVKIRSSATTPVTDLVHLVGQPLFDVGAQVGMGRINSMKASPRTISGLRAAK